jgi:hypothetical protein
MKKISSKIIISILLAIFLFSGVNFDLEKKGISRIVGVEKVSATTTTVPLGADQNLGASIKNLAGGYKIIGFLDAKFGAAMKIPITIYSFVIFTITLLINALVFVFAGLLDLITYLSIGQFKSVVDSAGITLAWTTIRDIINISFIFVLLYISITTILGSAGPKQKATIAHVVIAALLINFSLFFTRIAIDAGNYVAVALFNKTGGTLGQASVNFMQATKITSVFNLSFTLTSQTSKLIVMYTQMIFGIMLIWAFASAAFLFLGRMVVLLFLMATSPIGFVGDAIPWFKEYSDQWKKTLFGQIMVAPIFFLFMIIINEFLKNANKINILANGVWGDTYKLGPIIYYAIVLAFLIIAVKVTKKMSGEVGNMAIKLIKAAVAAVAIAVTGGTLLAAGGIAAAAGKTGMGRFAGNVGKFGMDFARGKIGERPGAVGIAARFSRGLVMDKIKDASDGKIDLKKIEGSYKKGLVDEEKRIRKEADRKEAEASKDEHGRPARERLDEIESTEKSIKNQTNSRFSNPALIEEHTKALKTEEEAQRKLNEALREIELAPDEKTKKDLRAKSFEYEEEHRIAKGKSIVLKNQIDSEKEALTIEIEKEMGVTRKDLDTEKKSLQPRIDAGIKARKTYANQIESSISSKIQQKTGLGMDRKKVAQAIRMQEGRKYKDEKDDIIKAIKNMMDGNTTEKPKEKEEKKIKNK